MNEQQPNILQRCPEAYCGMMLGYEFDQPSKALQFLIDVADLPFTDHGERWYTVAFTHAGLQQLGAAADLSRFPEAFVAGMAKRAARLCDPPWPQYGAGEAPDAGLAKRARTHAVLLVLQRVRRRKVDGEPPPHDLFEILMECGDAAQRGDALSVDEGKLNSALEAAFLAKALPQVCLAHSWHQPLHQPLMKHDASDPTPAPVVEYFGFRDGIGQPKIDGGVNPDVVLVADDNPLLSGGSYLVIRQLQQDTRAFWQAMRGPNGNDQQTRERAELLLGRRQNGNYLDNRETPFDADGECGEPPFTRELGEAAPVCPFQSHVRRVSPPVPAAAPERKTPKPPQRLLRRAMSYRDGNRLGMMFMAYNANLEAQFEFIQANWIARGNSAGGQSSHRDPIAALSGSSDTPSVPTFVAGTGPSATALALQSFVQLRWGEYFFVPSRTGMQRLQAVAAERAGKTAQRALSPMRLKDALASINHPRAAREFWEHVPDAGLWIDGHFFVKRPQDVEAILRDPKPSHGHSVCEYGRRMRTMLGPITLALDSDSADYARASKARAILPDASRPEQLAKITQWAKGAARAFLESSQARAQLRNMVAYVGPATFRSDKLIAFVLAAVWDQWAGLPGPSSGSFATWGLHTTQAMARLDEPARVALNLEQGEQDGHDLLQYIRQQLASLDAAASAALDPAISPAQSAQPKQPPARVDRDDKQAQQSRLRTFRSELQALYGAQPLDEDELVRTIAALVGGSAPTTAGTFIEGVARWFAQHRGVAQLSVGEQVDASAPSPLYDAIIARSLAHDQAAAPDYLYRTYKGEPRPLDAVDGAQTLRCGDRVIVWLGGATEFRFGAGAHRCPGRDMAKAIMEGALQAFSETSKLEPIDASGVEFAFELPKAQ